MMNRFIRVNGQDFSFDEVAKALGVELPEGITDHQIQLCQRVKTGVLSAGGSVSEDDEYPNIEVELQLPKEMDSQPVLLTRTEQPIPEDEEHELRTFCYSRNDSYFMFFDADTRADREVDDLYISPSVVLSGNPGDNVRVYKENNFVQYQGLLSPEVNSPLDEVIASAKSRTAGQAPHSFTEKER